MQTMCVHIVEMPKAIENKCTSKLRMVGMMNLNLIAVAYQTVMMMNIKMPQVKDHFESDKTHAEIGNIDNWMEQLSRFSINLCKHAQNSFFFVVPGDWQSK